MADALGAARQALAQEPGSVGARVALAQAFASDGDWLSAAAWLSDAWRIAPGNRDIAVALAELSAAQWQWSSSSCL